MRNHVDAVVDTRLEVTNKDLEKKKVTEETGNGRAAPVDEENGERRELS